MPSLQLIFSLRHPEQYAWEQDRDFDPRVHTRLLSAHQRILQSVPGNDHRPQVEAQLLRLRRSTMSQRQEMLLYYLLAQCVRARDLSLSAHFGQALEWSGRAEQIAGMLVDRGAQVDLHELRGTLHRATSLFWIAAEEFSLALCLLRELAEDRASFDPEYEVALAAKTAALDYLSGNFARALEHVQRAEALLPLTTASLAGEGNIAWTLALLHRQRNMPVEALEQVERAAALYRRLGATNSTCRVLSLAADIALDCAESPSGDNQATSETYLTLAAHYLEEALWVGQEAKDAAGIGLARLSHARLARLAAQQGLARPSGTDTDRVTDLDRISTTVTATRTRAGTHAQTQPHSPQQIQDPEATIRSVLQQAHRLRDKALLAAAQTALGADLLARGATAEGKRWLRRAVATATRINTPALAFRAQRCLRQAEGRNA